MQERTYCDILNKRDLAGDTAASKTDKLDLTNVFCDDEGRLPLEDAKRQVLKNLRILEVTSQYLGIHALELDSYIQVAKYTSSKDGCHSIIEDLAQDILNQRDHRLVLACLITRF